MPDEPRAHVLVINPNDLEMFALMSIELLQKHPETASEMFEKFAGAPPPETFLESMIFAAEAYVKGLHVARERAERELAEAEARVIPKGRLN